MHKYKADRIADEIARTEEKIKAISIDSAESLVDYFKLYTKLVFDYKEIGNLYDIYADDVIVYRENGYRLTGAHDVVRDASVLLAAFPDLEITFRNSFAVKADDCFKLWRFYHINGTNLSDSKYGPPTYKKIEGDTCLVMSMSTVKIISGRPQIIKEFTMYSGECIRDTCTL